MPITIAPLSLIATKNRRLGCRRGVSRRITNLNAVCSSDVLEPHRQFIALEKLAEAWLAYENSHQNVLGMVAEYQVDNEQVAFLEMEGAYEAAINNAKKTIRRKHNLSEQHS